jgi:hypothetical protein
MSVSNERVVVLEQEAVSGVGPNEADVTERLHR